MAVSAPATIAIYVFSLFHPKEVEVAPVDNSVLRVRCGQEETRLEGAARKTLNAGCRVESYSGNSAIFELSVPGRITRQYKGTAEIHASGNELLPVVRMDTETVVAAMVAAELSSDLPLASFEAQAIASRSYLVAGGKRHRVAHSCDTTHCQFMREPPGPNHKASIAAEKTRGQLLYYNGRVIHAMYSAACRGFRERRKAVPPGAYPFFDVQCDHCLRNPAKNLPGHRNGLCQTGARHMAEGGATATEILAHYYPGTSLQLSPGTLLASAKKKRPSKRPVKTARAKKKPVRKSSGSLGAGGR